MGRHSRKDDIVQPARVRVAAYLTPDLALSRYSNPCCLSEPPQDRGTVVTSGVALAALVAYPALVRERL
jgi:hypothetical protein